MPRKTIKSLEATITELRELGGYKERQIANMNSQLSDIQQRLKDNQTRQHELLQDKTYLQRLCSELSVAIRTRS